MLWNFSVWQPSPVLSGSPSLPSDSEAHSQGYGGEVICAVNVAAVTSPCSPSSGGQAPKLSLSSEDRASQMEFQDWKCVLVCGDHGQYLAICHMLQTKHI